MHALTLLLLPALFCLAFTGCVASPTIVVSAVDRYGTPQPHARLGAQWLHRAASPEDRVVVLQDSTDEDGHFTIRDTELPDFIDVWSPDTGRSATLHHVKWGYNVIVLR